MFRRIGFNFRSNLRWMLERFFLFLLLMSFFSAALLMSGLSKTVSDQYLKDVDLYVTVTEDGVSFTKWGDLHDHGPWHPGDETDAQAEELEALYKQLRTLPGVEWSDFSYDSGRDFPIWMKEPGNMGIILDLNEYNQDDLDPSRYETEEKWLSAVRRSILHYYDGIFAIGSSSYRNPGGGFTWYINDGDPIELYGCTEIDYENPTRLDTDYGWRLNASQQEILCGITNPMPRDFQLGKREITEGRLFTQEELDAGEMVCVIPENLGFIERDYIFESWHLYKLGTDVNLAVPLLDPEGNLVDELDFKLKIIGTYQPIHSYDDEELKMCPNRIYLPQQVLFRIRDAAWQYYQDNSRSFFDFPSLSYLTEPSVLLFKLDTLAHLDAFSDAVEALPGYQAGKISYFAEVGKVIDMLSGFYGVTASFRSLIWVFAGLALAMAVLVTVLDAFYRRREIAILQSMGELPRRITLQFVLELLIVLILSAAAALPLAMVGVRAAIPKLVAQAAAKASADADVLNAGELRAAVTVSGDAMLGTGLLILAALLVCWLTVYLLTKHFSVRKLLN